MSDWQAVADEETGETYYHNVVTDETQWEMPDDFVPDDDSIPPDDDSVPPDDNSIPPDDESLPPEDDDSTIPPEEAPDDESTIPPDDESTVPPIEDESESLPSSSAPNSSIPSQSMDKQKSLRNIWGEIIEENEFVSDEEDEEEGLQIGDWIQHKTDDGKSEPYYYNVATHQTTWDPPEEFKALQEADKALENYGDIASRHVHKIKLHGRRSRHKDSVLYRPQTEWATTVNLPIDEIIARYSHLEFEDYGKGVFNMERRGIMKTNTTLERVSQWKSQPIGLPLIKSHKKQEGFIFHMKFSREANRRILNYMKDRTSVSPSYDHAIVLCQLLLKGSQLLIDEIYCQLIKQTSNNPREDSFELGWELILICASVMPPSNELLPYVYSHCLKHLESSVESVEPFAYKTIQMLMRISKLPPRVEKVTKVEVLSARMLEEIGIRVYFVDGKYSVINIDSLTTVAELETKISKMLNLKDTSPFALFEVSEDTMAPVETDDNDVINTYVNSDREYRVLRKDTRIMEVFSMWNKFYWQARKLEGKKVGAKFADKYHLLYKNRYFLDVESNDVSSVELSFIQARHDVIESLYPCTEQDAFSLAALQCQEEFGDHPSGHCTFLHGLIVNFLPLVYRQNQRESDLEFQIYRLYKKLRGYSQHDARLSYLDYCQTWKYYGSHFFDVESVNKNMPDGVVLAINKKGLIVIDKNTRETVSSYELNKNIVSWGVSASSFILLVGSTRSAVIDTDSAEKVYFKTPNGQHIHELLEYYSNALFQKRDADTDNEAMPPAATVTTSN